MTTYGYARVSTSAQARDGNSLEYQKKALEAAGATEIYADTFTGAKSNRPQLNALVSKLRVGDTIAVTKLDRLSRSMTDGVSIVKQLMAQGIRVHVLNMGVVENSPVGRMILAVMFAMAEFEREMIYERTAEGKRIAKEKPGYREGRPSIEDTIGKDKIVAYVKDYKAGKIKSKQAYTELGIGESTWYKMVKKYGGGK